MLLDGKLSCRRLTRCVWIPWQKLFAVEDDPQTPAAACLAGEEAMERHRKMLCYRLRTSFERSQCERAVGIRVLEQTVELLPHDDSATLPSERCVQKVR